LFCAKKKWLGEKNNILSHNVVLSTPHHEQDSKLALIAQVFVNLLGIYDQSLICAETSGPIYIV
jgi:hypothetical protein